MTLHLENFLFIIGITLTCAIILGEIFERIGLSKVLGEVLAGVIVGPLVLGLSTPDLIKPVAEIGIVLLLFVVGTEIDFDEFSKMGRNLSQITFFDVGTAYIFGFIIGSLLDLGNDWRTPIFLGLAFSATSMGITIRTLEGMGKIDSEEGKTIIGVALLDDVVGLFLLLLISALILGGTIPEIVIGAFILIIFILITLFLLPEIFSRLQWISEYSKNKEFTVGLIFGILLIIAYLAETTGLATALGAFLFGVSLRKAPDIVAEVDEKIRTIGSVVFIPLFFSFVGMNLALPTGFFGIEMLVIIVGALSCKIIGVMIGAVSTRMSFQKSLRVAVGMIPRAEVILVISQIAFDEAIFDSLIFSAIILLVFVSTLLTPIVLKVTYSISDPDDELIPKASI